MPESSGGRSSVGGIVAAVGGVIVAIGAFLTWFTASVGGRSINAKGTDVSDGKIALVVGVLLVLAGIMGLVVSSGGARKLAAVGAIILGVAALGLGILELATKNSQFEKGLRKGLEKQVGRPISDTEFAQAKALLDRLGLKLSVGIGLYAVMAGGLIGLVGGVMGAGAKEPTPSAPAFEPIGGAQPYAAPMSPPPSSTPTPPPGAPSPPPPPGAPPPGRDATQFAPPPAPPPEPPSG